MPGERARSIARFRAIVQARGFRRKRTTARTRRRSASANLPGMIGRAFGRSRSRRLDTWLAAGRDLERGVSQARVRPTSVGREANSICACRGQLRMSLGRAVSSGPLRWAPRTHWRSREAEPVADQSKIRRAGLVRGGAFTRCVLGRGGVELGDERPSNGSLQVMGSRRESWPAGSPGTAVGASPILGSGVGG